MGKQIDHNSFWVIKQNPITKIGVFPYLGRQISPELEPNKIYQVLRPESELFAAEALASFNELPITIGHALLGPREEGFTPAEEKGIDGTTGTTAERKGDKVVNDIKLFSERIKDELNHGKKELSAGYFCDFVPERGTWNGRHYDFVQKNIRGNHIALVDKGRSGHDVRVMDSAEGVATRQFVCDAMDIEGKIEQHEVDMKKNANDADLSSETNGDGGKHAAPNKENEMDKREVIREIMAISAKPVTEFKGGEEEKVEAIAKLAEKLAYNPSEAGANDACPGSNPKDEPKGNASDEDDPKDEPKDEPKEDKKAASLDEMEKELLARMGRKTELVKRLTPIIGAFDSAAMTEKEVAAYACEKLNLSAAMDEAPAVVKGYLAGRAKNDVRVTFGAKAKTSAQDEILNNFKEGK